MTCFFCKWVLKVVKTICMFKRQRLTFKQKLFKKNKIVVQSCYIIYLSGFFYEAVFIHILFTVSIIKSEIWLLLRIFSPSHCLVLILLFLPLILGIKIKTNINIQSILSSEQQTWFICFLYIFKIHAYSHSGEEHDPRHAYTRISLSNRVNVLYLASTIFGGKRFFNRSAMIWFGTFLNVHVWNLAMHLI